MKLKRILLLTLCLTMTVGGALTSCRPAVDPGGESTAEVVERTRDFLMETVNDPQNDGKTLLITTHGGAMRALLQEVYGHEEDFWHGGVPDNCTVNIAMAEDGKFTLVADDTIYYDPALSKNPYKKYR